MTAWTRCGQAIAIGRALAVTIGIALAWSLAKYPFEKMETVANENVTNETAATGLSYTMTVFDNFLYITLSITVLGVIALAVYQRRGGL